MKHEHYKRQQNTCCLQKDGYVTLQEATTMHRESLLPYPHCLAC